jgi:hypothetical protein
MEYETEEYKSIVTEIQTTTEVTNVNKILNINVQKNPTYNKIVMNVVDEFGEEVTVNVI